MKKILLIALLATISAISGSFAQIPIGAWREHLPYSQVIKVAEAPTRIYAATANSLFYIDLTDNSISRLSKINGLSDVGISSIAYNSAQNALVIAYTNSNIDILKNNVVINISDISRKPIPANKDINNITCDSNFAYLACGFGVVVLDLKRVEIKETWIPGNQSSYMAISDLNFYKQKIYLSTASGVLFADKNSPNLADYNTWSSDTNQSIKTANIAEIKTFGNHMIAHVVSGDSSFTYLFNDSTWVKHTFYDNSKKHSISTSSNELVITYAAGNIITFDTTLAQTRFIFTYNPGFINAHYATFDREGNIWVGDNSAGLVWISKINQWNCIKHQINGPNMSDVWRITGNDQKMILLRGAFSDACANLWSQATFSVFANETWSSLDQTNNSAIDSLYDLVYATINPANPESCWLSSWGKGLVHMEGNKITEVYNGNNSPLEQIYGQTYVGGLCFDKENNLWMVNSNVANGLKVLTPSKNWYQFSLSPYSNNTNISSLAIDSSGNKWILLPRTNGIIVYDDNGTIANTSDDRKILLNMNTGTRVSTTSVNCFTSDLQGDMWVGTDKGIKVFYNTASIFQSNGALPQTILIEQDGYVQNLLEFENVTAIAVDGANRKWIGTSKAGLFLVSPDGTVEMGHFMAGNSPLFSNEITSLAFNQKTGELFIGTKNGLCSYRTNATMGVDVIEKSEVYAFPNPVTSDFNGEIAIKGLTTDANVKITNSNGVLVYQTIANGGQAVWNGKNFSGEKVATGVYLVFSSNEDGSEKVVTKILFVQ